MADSGDTGLDETARLEAALARIARARPQPARRDPGAPPDAPGVDAARLAARLDALIAELRSVLGREAGD